MTTFCVIGRPNVGKSSLVNAILKEDRAIVSNVEGTTRDAVDTPFRYEGRDYVIIDTAGMRKRGKSGRTSRSIPFSVPFPRLSAPMSSCF